MLAIDTLLQPSELLASWRSKTGRLFLSTTEQPVLRERVAARIRLGGRRQSATVQGRVVSIGRGRALHRVELAPDAESLRAVQLLLAAARGESVPYFERAPRFLLRRPVVVASPDWQLLMTTRSISELGCSLEWAGPTPTVGEQLSVRLGPSWRDAEVSAMVRWVSPAARAAAAGLSVLLGPAARFAWAGLLLEAVQSGAPLV
jgi:hypothetical protein